MSRVSALPIQVTVTVQYNESEQVLCTAVTQQQAIFIFPKSYSLFQETPYQHSVILHALFSIHKFRLS